MMMRLAWIFLLVACGRQQPTTLEEWLNEPGFILEKPVSLQEVNDLEKNLGAQSPKCDDALYVCFKRKVPGVDHFEVLYHFNQDKLASVVYHLGNENTGLDETHQTLVQFMDQRFGKGEHAPDLSGDEITWTHSQTGARAHLRCVYDPGSKRMVLCMLEVEFR